MNVPLNRKTRRFDDLETARMMHRALVMHFVEERAQKDIAVELGVSHASVNRLIKRGRALGLVEIRIKSPVEHLVVVEQALRELGGLERVVVVPTLSDNPQTVMQSVGRAAAETLLDTTEDGNTVCLTGGKGVSALVNAMEPLPRRIGIYPATGLVRGHYYTDVNHVAGKLAEKLGGTATPIHAPMFADSHEMRDMLLSMSNVRAVFDKARAADVAVVGIGSILSEGSSYYDLHPHSETDRREIEVSGARAELLAHLLDGKGQLCEYALNKTLVGVTLDEFRRIPVRIGVAAGADKALPILSILRGRYLSALVTDEATAKKILDLAREDAE